MEQTPFRLSRYYCNSFVHESFMMNALLNSFYCHLSTVRSKSRTDINGQGNLDTPHSSLKTVETLSPQFWQLKTAVVFGFSKRRYLLYIDASLCPWYAGCRNCWNRKHCDTRRLQCHNTTGQKLSRHWKTLNLFARACSQHKTLCIPTVTRLHSIYQASFIAILKDGKTVPFILLNALSDLNTIPCIVQSLTIIRFYPSFLCC